MIDNEICILFSSLRYEAVSDRVEIMTREQLSRIRYEQKTGNYPDWLIERITDDRFIKERERIEHEQFSREYDKAIMKKYNVGKDYANNRWFMEQVRPTLF